MDREISDKDKRKRKIKIIGSWIGVAAVVGTGVGLLLGLQGTAIKKSQLTFCTVETGDVENSVAARGKVIPAYEETVISPVTTKILEVFHQEGETVDAGEPLLRLDTEAAETEMRRIGDRLAVSRNSTTEQSLDSRTFLTNLEMQIEAKRMAVEELEAEVRNEKRLDSIGSGTGDRVRQAELAWRTGKIELEQLQRQLVNERQARAARIESSRLQERIQQRDLDDASRLLADAGVKAPRKATITYINDHIGGSVAAGEKLAVLSDLDHFRITGELPEGDADKVSPGATVEIKLGTTRLRGRIGSITPQAANGMIGFSVLPEKNDDPRLRAGIGVDLNLICGLKENVIRIPNGTYFHGPGTYTLYVCDSDGKTLRQRQVLLGDSNFDYVEVKSGLQPGEKVVISDMSGYNTKQELKITD